MWKCTAFWLCCLELTVNSTTCFILVHLYAWCTNLPKSSWGAQIRQLSILPNPRCSCAFLFSIISNFLFSISFSLCFRLISRCKNAHLSSTSLDISVTAALTKTSIIDDNWVWKGIHVAMLLHTKRRLMWKIWWKCPSAQYFFPELATRTH